MSASQSLRWPKSGPLQQPDSFLDYGYNASTETRGGTDPIQSVSLSVKPSGDGEMAASNLSVVDGIITVWLRGGYPGRIYTIRIDITTAAGRVFERLITMPIDAALAPAHSVAAPSLDFGEVLTWPAD